MKYIFIKNKKEDNIDAKKDKIYKRKIDFIKF